MKINAILPEKGRDLRLDLFRGIANWAIFLDHIPDNVVNWVTTRNYGFSDAADLFVFISGYTASFVYARMMIERGFLVGATRLFKRVWQLYVAHIILFVIYIASISYLALSATGVGTLLIAALVWRFATLHAADIGEARFVNTGS